MIAPIVAVPAVRRAPVVMRIDEQRDAWRRLCSTEVGLIKELYELKVDPSEVPMYVFNSRCGPNLQHAGALQKEVRGSGASLDRHGAMEAAVGEAIERYSPIFPDPDSITSATAADLGSEALGPEHWPLFSDAQYDTSGFRYPRFTPTTRVAWTAVQQLGSDRRPLVPVSFVYLAYHHKGENASICPQLSTGLACATDPTVAMVKGLYECVERDAFNITWLNRLERSPLDVRGVDEPRLQELLARIAHARLTPHFVWLTMEAGIATVLCAIVDDTGTRPAVAVGAAANLDPVRATVKATEEAAHGRQFLRWLVRTTNKRFTPDFSNVADFNDHVLVYASSEMAARLRFLYDRRPPIALRDLPSAAHGTPADDLDTARQLLERVGFRVYYRDVTTADVESVGFHVYRTIVPGLQNINGPHAWRFLGGRRLYEAPVQLGLRDRPLAEHELNQDPHPFP